MTFEYYEVYQEEKKTNLNMVKQIAFVNKYYAGLAHELSAHTVDASVQCWGVFRFSTT